MAVHIHLYILFLWQNVFIYLFCLYDSLFIKDYTLLLTFWLFLPASPSVSPELLSAYSGSLSLSSALDPPSPVTWFPLTLRATLAPPPLRRHPPTHTHGRPTVGSVFLRGRLRGDVAGVYNGSLSVMMDHSSIWCPPVHGGADCTV